MRVLVAIGLTLGVCACAGLSDETDASPAGAVNRSTGTCTQTLSVGADIASAVSSAPNDSTICLNSGDHGSQTFDDVDRSGFVTVRSASGVSAQMQLKVGNSDYIRFENLTLSESDIASCASHIEVRGSSFIPNAAGLAISSDGVACSLQSIVVDGNTFDRVEQTTWAGRLSVCRGNGVQISNNTFSGTGVGASDGIQLTCDATNITVGPGNQFFGIRQGDCDAATPTTHCDSIQFVDARDSLVYGNYFYGSDVFIMAPDGSSNVTVRDNVFDGSGNPYLDKIQFGSAASPVFRHNTLRDVRVSFDSKPGNPASSGVQAIDNIMDGSASWKTTSGSGCSGCELSHNLHDDRGSVTGSDNLIGRPSFVGGATPMSYSGWRLAAGSIGRKGATDGTDMGARIDSVPALSVKVSAKKVQKLARWVVVRVACAKGSCAATATGTLRVQDGRVTKRFRLGGARKRISVGERARLRLKLSRRARRSAERAARRRMRVRARLTITVRDAAGHKVVRHERVKLEP